MRTFANALFYFAFTSHGFTRQTQVAHARGSSYYEEEQSSRQALPEPEQQQQHIVANDALKPLALLFVALHPAAGWRAHGSAIRQANSVLCTPRRYTYPCLSIRAGPLVVALDFDGVLMDSEPELTRVAWRTGCSLWPQLTEECAVTEAPMDESAYAERRRLGGQPLCGSADDGMPNWLWTKMRFLRPVIQSDSDALLLVRLCMEEVLSEHPEKRPLTVDEITNNWSNEFKETLRLRYGLTERTAIDACNEVRAAWLHEEPTEWAGAHKHYKAVMSDLREAARPSLLPKPILYILTCRDAKYVRELLKRQSVKIGDACILSSTAKSKVDMLAMLRRRHAKAMLRFIDDDAYTLRAAARDPRLFSLKLFFAAWGYSGPEHEACVALMPRVNILQSSQDLETVFEMPRKDGISFHISM